MSLDDARPHGIEHDDEINSDLGYSTTYAPITPATMSGVPSAFQSSVATGRSSYDAGADDKALVKHSPDGATTSIANVPPSGSPQDEWEAGKQEWLIVICLATVSLMVALDATVIVTPLPVRRLHGRVHCQHY